MRVTAIFRVMALATLLAWMPATAAKFVAVVETDVDAASGASADINPAEVREITAEFRRQATELLPQDRYSVMTSETIQSMGGAVLEECSEENCVVALGARIGADFIVRGTINKFGAKLTLAVEMYETDNGTLVASSEAIRAQNIEELFDKGSVACANMFKKFVARQNAGQRPAAEAVADDAGQQAGKKGKAKKEKTAASSGGEQGEGAEGKAVFGKEVVQRSDRTLKYVFPVKMPISWGAVDIESEFVSSLWEGGIIGMDVLFGADKDSLLFGFGFSVGKGYSLGNQMQIVYGGSLDFLTVNGEGKVIGDDMIGWLFLTPRVKYRWRFLEVSAAWHLGVEDMYNGENLYRFYHSPQIMAGFYIKGRTIITRTQVTK